MQCRCFLRKNHGALKTNVARTESKGKFGGKQRARGGLPAAHHALLDAFGEEPVPLNLRTRPVLRPRKGGGKCGGI